MPVLPFSWMEPEDRKKLYLQAMEKVIAFGEDKLKVSRAQLACRELSAGDSAAYTDAVAIDWDLKTAATAGQEEWTEDSADLTAGDLSDVMAATFQQKDNSVSGVYGFIDNTPVADMTLIQVLNGSEKVITAEVEHCYTEKPYGGIFVDEKGNAVVALFSPKDYPMLRQNHKAAADKNVVWLGFTVEKKGVNITVSHLGR